MTTDVEPGRSKPGAEHDPGGRGHLASPSALPTWPITAMFAAYPLWWLLGMADVIWIATAAVMALYLARTSPLVAPRGFGIWLLFLCFMVISVIQVDKASRLLVFAFQGAHYAAVTALFLYLYNARAQLTERFITGSLTAFLAIVTVGGYLGMFLRTAEVRTPTSYILPPFLINNDLVYSMVVRRFSQFNPDSVFNLTPRPAAPFVYTNEWGNCYSMILPLVVVYAIKVWGEKRFLAVCALLALSLVPAFATLNRGMFLGLAFAALYAGIRYLFMGRPGVFLQILLAGATVGALLMLSPAQDNLNSRVEETGTTEDRVQIYTATIDAVRESPLLGYGTPRPSENPNIPPVGTHGQFWIVLHSHGIPAMLFFMGFALYCFVRSLPRRDPMGLLANTVILVGMIETLYYGFLPTGLYLLLIACALSLRPPDPGAASNPAARHRPRKALA